MSYVITTPQTNGSDIDRAYEQHKGVHILFRETIESDIEVRETTHYTAASFPAYAHIFCGGGTHKIDLMQPYTVLQISLKITFL